MKTIGILGGMGQACTSHFFNLMVRYQQVKLGFVEDEEFYPMVISNISLTNWDHTGFVKPNEVKRQLVDEIKKLAKFPCDIVVIPCNTVHYFYKEMQDAINVPVINIIDEVVKEVHQSKIKKVAVLSSNSTNRLDLYKGKLKVETIICNPQQQKIVDDAILNVQAGREVSNELFDIVREMQGHGAEGVILGCTELSIPFEFADYNKFDSSEILVKALFKSL